LIRPSSSSSPSPPTSNRPGVASTAASRAPLLLVAASGDRPWPRPGDGRPRCLYRPVGLRSGRRYRERARSVTGSCVERRRSQPWQSTNWSYPPTGTFSSPPISHHRLPKHSGTAGCGRTTSRSSRWSKGGADLPAAAHPRVRGLDDLPVPPDRRSDAEGDPETIVEDLEVDGVDVGVMHPNLSLFGLYSDDHELSIAHARVYNDYIIERFTPYFSRLAPPPHPLTDVGDAVAEIERVAAVASGPSSCRRRRPGPTTHGSSTRCGGGPGQRVHVFIHTQTGG